VRTRALGKGIGKTDKKGKNTDYGKGNLEGKHEGGEREKRLGRRREGSQGEEKERERYKIKFMKKDHGLENQKLKMFLTGACLRIIYRTKAGPSL